MDERLAGGGQDPAWVLGAADLGRYGIFAHAPRQTLVLLLN